MVTKIGNISLVIPVFQASLSGYTDLGMRVLAREFGAPLTYSGLMLDKSVIHPKVWKQGSFAIREDEKPIGGQLLGNEPELMIRAAQVMVDRGFDLLDLNFACPAPKVLARKRGGYFLKDPRKAVEIISQVRAKVDIPLTIKLRTSYYQDDVEKEAFWAICDGAVAEGIDGLFVHGRAVEQRYRDHADWEVIRQVKQRFPETIVFGSGDLFTVEEVVSRLKESDVDGVIVARGAIGNPWIFREIQEVLQGKSNTKPPGLAEVGAVMERHLEMLLDLYPPNKVIAYFRKFCVGYCRRHPQRKKSLLALMAAKTVEGVKRAIHTWFHD
jgi:tRNA-dihydrouridine synthase B